MKTVAGVVAAFFFLVILIVAIIGDDPAPATTCQPTNVMTPASVEISDEQGALIQTIRAETQTITNAERATVIAVGLAIQATNITNLSSIDPDIGQGVWALLPASYPSVDVVDPRKATQAVVSRIVLLDNWETMPINQIGDKLGISGERTNNIEQAAETVVASIPADGIECTADPITTENVSGKITRVSGIEVANEIADQVQALLTAASKAGVNLTGWGYRSNQRQIELRINHCGGDNNYAIYQKPSRECRPPTATPGKSQHEKGLAIDFKNCHRQSTCFQWLSVNAARFGLKNLPSESWHWSTTGR